MTGGSAGNETDDNSREPEPKQRSDAEFAFCFSAVGALILGLWSWTTDESYAWVSLVPAIVLFALGLLARWVHKP
jgi:hypothetical protein